MQIKHPEYLCGSFDVSGKCKTASGNSKQRRLKIRMWKRKGHVVTQYTNNGRVSMPTKLR